MIETLEDIVEQVANACGIYGSHDERCDPPKHWCRSCFTADLSLRIEAAVEIERAIAHREIIQDMTEAQLQRLGVQPQEFLYRCQCGGGGTFETRHTALAVLVRLARADHDHGGKCGDPDIEEVDTAENLAKKRRDRQRAPYIAGKGFC